MRIYEYKMDSNGQNEVVPGCIDHSDCGHFYNPANYTYVGVRFSDKVKVPDTMVELTRAALKVRCKIAGVMMQQVGESQVQMSDSDIDAAVDAFCDARSVV